MLASIQPWPHGAPEQEPKMTEQNQHRTVVFVSLTGDEQIKLYDLDPQSGA